MELDVPEGRRSASVETARLLELLDQSNRLLEKHSRSDPEAQGKDLLSLRLAHDLALTRVLRLSAQASEIAASHKALFEAKRALEQEVERFHRNRAN